MFIFEVLFLSSTFLSLCRCQITNFQNNKTNLIGDDELLEIISRQTFGYFYDYAHPISKMARERAASTSTNDENTVTVGGTGFGIMVIISGVYRGWITRDNGVRHLLTMVKFLEKAERYHGAYPHWMNGETGKTIPFDPDDDGGDLVETSFLFQGLLTACSYFGGNSPEEKDLRKRISSLWNDVEWDWYTKEGKENALFWHWSKNVGWKKNMKIQGWNEGLMAYLLAASSQTHGINATVYHEGFARNGQMVNGNKYYGITLPLGEPSGGPLFFTHYSFLGLCPRGLKDKYADYEEQNLAHAKINRAYCLENPKKFKGYSEKLWGLTACDTYNKGYGAWSPTNDQGTIAPTAALSSVVYLKDEALKVARELYENPERKQKMWKKYGFVDSLNDEHEGWVATDHLAIDQGPIVAMIENSRSEILWKYFMRIEDIQGGLKLLGFTSTYDYSLPSDKPKNNPFPAWAIVVIAIVAFVAIVIVVSVIVILVRKRKRNPYKAIN
ncbi:putative beta-glucosidase [Monocercomonoides exilis]|uniref:putative beta-glucosidase n=1 Tax=Monocercomonoides exilis TaxID=2049356 RepID=UPI003559388A|nr:putative beta-glucosidase [Monocercomonoides exilis]|eukprot:MONOS_3093.1-p1 / transcript=MONOS_3093.1 / gene=MONOS_3093 / organism=Monocercomonoides_exilis_PA203 / gene_product=beta-glucosidase / transcript_product=beta-glucosidase / location=Mono_scaffold00069:97373-98866(-) / protein_length=498 / sequence_SO=supercontig / SO=protein_coding / is_pseudo=false